MRRTIIVAALLPLAACHLSSSDDGSAPGVAAQGSGPTRSYAVADFTRVQLRGSDTVEVRVGPGFAVRAEGDPEALDRLRIVRDGDTLRIGRRRGAGWGGGGHKATVFVTLPALAGAGVTGSGAMRVDRVEGDSFDASNTGSGSLAVPAMKVADASLSMAGSGTMTLGGTAGALKVEVAGSGTIEGRNLRAAHADVSVAGSGDVTATVAGDARVSMMGSGSVTLGPDARCEVSKMGSGTVRCGG